MTTTVVQDRMPRVVEQQGDGPRNLRQRILLQERLIEFVLNEKNWSDLLLSEQSRLLQQLGTRDNSSNPFAHPIHFMSRDEKGNRITRKANLLLDTSRNHNLSAIFDQVAHSAFTQIIREYLDSGLLDMLARLLQFQDQVLAYGRQQTSSIGEDLQSLMVETFPLALEDLRLIQSHGLGLALPVIPYCLRTPLNTIYQVIHEQAHTLPSLAFQFHLGLVFPKRDRQGIWPLMLGFVGKAFYTVVRMQGLTSEQLHMPEVNWLDRLDYFTLDDESERGAWAASEGELLMAGPALQILRGELERLKRESTQIKQRREIQGPAVKTELTLEQVLKDIFREHQSRIAQQLGEDETEFLSATLWLPSEITLFSPWEEADLDDYLHWSQSLIPDLPTEEADLIDYWTQWGIKESQDPRTQSQLKALDLSDPNLFIRTIERLMAHRHRCLLQQNVDLIIQGACKQVTRLVLNGTLEARSLVRDRLNTFEQEVMPYLFYYETELAAGEKVWIPSPYVHSKLYYAIDRIEEYLAAEEKPPIEKPILAKGQEMLEELGSILREMEGSAAVDPDLI